MNKYLSIKLKIISFILIILVVFLHSNNLVVTLGAESTELDKGYSSFIQNFISFGLARIAVPLFFSISGYLFFLNMNGSASEFFSKFIKRSKTVVIPYLFWSVWSLFVYLILQSIPQLTNFFTRKHVINYSILEYADAIFLNPIAYQLWFMRDLFLLIILSPIIYYLLKYFKSFTVLFFFIVWVCDTNLEIMSSEALLFFVLGGYFAILKKELIFTVYTKNAIAYSCLWLAIVLIKTILVFSGHANDVYFILAHKISVVVGVWCIWILYDYLFAAKDLERKFKFEWLFSFSFFIYVFHEPALAFIKKALLFMLGKGEATSLAIYFITPAIVIFMSICIGFYLKKIAPKFYSIITGGR